jgi:hypothetical protein
MHRMGMARWIRIILLIAAAGLTLPAASCGHAQTVPLSGTPGTSPAAVAPVSPVTPSASALPPTPTAPAGTRSATAPSANRIAARVTVQRTGGFAGVSQELVVEADGRWRYTASRGPDAGAVKTGRLGAAQRERLQGLLGDPSFGSAWYPGTCADGFHYSLVTGERRVEWDECGDNPAKVAQAIVALLAGATPF